MSVEGVVLLGCHDLGAYLLPRLVDDGLAPSCVVTVGPETASSHSISGYRDLRPVADSLGIPSRVAAGIELTEASDQSFFRESRFSVLIQGGWPHLIPGDILASLQVGGIGVHGGPDFLPRGRGRSPMTWALIEGRRRFLLQFFVMTPRADAGAVFDCEQFDITPFDTIATMYMKNAMATRAVLRRSLAPLLAGRIEKHPQVGTPTYLAGRNAGDGRIDWGSMDVWAIHDFVRAQSRPYPGAFATVDGRDVRIWRAQVFDTRLTYRGAEYGQVVERFDGVLIVNCLGGLLLVDDYETI
jgi:methionyl-tRNA formyltransferase